jgi:hypothetical protein
MPVTRGFRCTILFAAIALAALGAACSGQSEGRPYAKLTPLVEHEEVAAGKPVRLALSVSFPKGVHTQSNKAPDPFLPTTLEVTAPEGFIVDEIVWPPATPFKLNGSDDPLSVFEHEFVIGLTMSVARGTAPGARSVGGKFGYQACDEISCYAKLIADVEWPVNVVAGPVKSASLHDGIFKAIPFGHGEKPGANPDTGGSPPDDPAPTGDPLAQLDGFKTLGVTGGYMGSGEFLTFVRNAENGIVEKGLFEGRGPLAILLIVFLGGLALNLTPCVLPMIPINLAIIGAGAQAGSRSRGFILGAAYGAAMAFVYGVLGLIVILTAGTFGEINASPWFNAGIAALFVVLGLAMFDILLIDFSSYSSWFRAGGEKRGTLLLAFSMGAVAALLAGA